MTSRRLLCAIGALLFAGATASAQTPDPPRHETDPLVSSYDAAFLRDLPTTDNLFAVIDTMQPSIVADRISSGGLFVGQPARVGGFLPSWTQTLFRIDGVAFTDPTGSGTPMLSPELLFWSNVRVQAGAFGADTNAPGLGIDLRAATPTDRWTGTLEGAFSHGTLDSNPPGGLAPSIERVAGYDRAAAIVSGPLVKGRLGGTFALSGTRGLQASRGDAFPLDARAQSALSHLVFTPDAANTLRLFAWVQRTEHPLEQRNMLARALSTTATSGGHGHLVWDHRADTGIPWAISTGYTVRRDAPDYGGASSGTLERLVQGPVTQFSALSRRTVSTLSAAARLEPRVVIGARTHQFAAGLDTDRGQLVSSSFFDGVIGELVHGSPARVWRFTSPGVDSRRHATTVAVFVGDRMTLSNRLTLDAGLRVESATGAADGAANGIAWHSALPHLSVHWRLADRWRTAIFGEVSRSAARLALDELAVGDPFAPTAQVYRWNALAGFPLSLADRGALIARAGPGTGGTPSFSSIDPALRRPTSNELVLGVQFQPRTGVMVRVAGVTREERNLAGLVNVGAPFYSFYTSFPVQDPGGDVLNSADDRTLTVYNRLPLSYGIDRYVLATPAHSGSTFKGIELTLQFNTSHFTLTGGGTAGLAETFANSLGYGPLENDQTVVGELFSVPNSSTLAHGRPFTDRGFTGKIATVYRFPREVRLGLIARYQDGQAFSRVLVFPGLNQGADAVRAFPNGDSRFMFVGTLDGRLQKTFLAGGRKVDAFVDAYNLLNMRNSVEEDVAAPPDVRTPIALQPPRSVHVGFRVTF